MKRDKFIAIVGLPRSGTTLLTALLDRHSKLSLYYEPFNASKEERPPVPQDLSEFRAWMEQRFDTEAASPVATTGFKETTTNRDTTAWAVDTANSLARTCDVHVVWIQRDPVHCLLSKLDGAKKWWGYPDAHFSRESLEEFLIDTETSYEVLGELVRDHDGCVVRYEALTANPGKTTADLMKSLGEPYEPSQLDYVHDLQRNKVMGDPGLIENPSSIATDAMLARAREAEQYRDLIDDAFGDPRFKSLIAQFARYAALPAVSKLQGALEP